MSAWPWIVGAGLLLRLVVAAAFHGSADIEGHLLEGTTVLRGQSVYEHTPGNKLPLGYALPAAMLLLSSWIGLPFPFVMKLPAIAGDLLAAVLLRSAGRAEPAAPSGDALAALYLLNPATVMLSGYHGNVDPLMAALMLAALVLKWRGAPTLAGAALGAAIAIKLPAALAFPVLLMNGHAGTSRWRFAGAAVAVPALLSAPFAIGDPAFARVFAYGSLHGVWGITLVVQQTAKVVAQLTAAPGAVVDALQALNAAAIAAGRYVLLGVLAMWFLYLARRRDGVDARAETCRVAATFMVFYVFTPGFGVQYLSWAVPFLVLASRRLAVAYVAAITPFLLGRYAQAALPAKYGVPSVTAILPVLSAADLTLLVATGAAGLVAWATCAWIAFHLRGKCAMGRFRSGEARN